MNLVLRTITPLVEKNMAKYGILLALLFVGGFAFPASREDGLEIEEDMSFFFDHTDVESRIVGGTNAPNGAYPWMAAMTNGPNQSFLCGGSIITNTRILSAAHCIVAAAPGGQTSRTLNIRVGTNRWSRGGQTYAIARHINHPHYNANNLKNDLGFLVPSRALVFNNNVRVIPISWDFVGAGVPVRVSGWGNIRTGGPLSATLRELRMHTFDAQRCVTEVARQGQGINMRVPHVDPNLEICTFHSVNHGACNGDSGSPLVRNSNNHQIGIVSWGLPCARGAPDMFVRCSAYRTWINNALF